MLIGEDFTKIVIEFNGLFIQEPNALITDLLMGSVSIFFAFRIKKQKSQHSFLKYWYYFFLTFGIGSVLGGFAHAFFLYTGPQGKFPTWISAILSAYFIEKAMIKSANKLNRNNILVKIAFTKMILVFLIVITVISTEAYQKDHTIGFIPIAINTLIGVFISVALISLYNVKQGHVNFKYLLWGVLVMLPSFFIFLFKINPIQWFDKSDLSHIIIIAGNCFFYLGLQKLDYSESPFLS
jgi:uncharacterized membrane protein YeaQ/YmgE (transglycosylase-associated protein family)